MEDKIKEILEKVILDEDFIDSEDLVDDGYLDSFDIVSLVSELNKYFNIKIIIKDIKTDYFKNVDTIVELVKKYQE